MPVEREGQLPCRACAMPLGAGCRYCPRCGAPQAGAAVSSVTPLTPLLTQWRGLKADLTRKEVRRVLGEPLRVEPSAPPERVLERWIYAYEARGARPEPGQAVGRLAGMLLFAPDGRLVTWEEPDWERLAP